MLQGFKQFILKGNVVDLAVGIIIGASFSAVVNSLVKDVITPFIGLIGGQPNFSAITFSIHNNKFFVGDFINMFLAFFINALVIYFFIVLPMNKFITAIQRKTTTDDPTTKKCPECLSVIPFKARRCGFCTSILEKKK